MDKDQLIREYVEAGKVMQLATVGEEGPWMCHVWYALDWSGQRLLFTSRTIRTHSRHLESDGRVAGGILNALPNALGEPVQGVTFTGIGRVVRISELAQSLVLFCKRWPAANLVHAAIENGSTNSRLYEVLVDRWILHDEVNSPNDPRFELESTH
jgi:uncharacterized protein YhbP (UPF0306 family)